MSWIGRLLRGKKDLCGAAAEQPPPDAARPEETPADASPAEPEAPPPPPPFSPEEIAKTRLQTEEMFLGKLAEVAEYWKNANRPKHDQMLPYWSLLAETGAMSLVLDFLFDHVPQALRDGKASHASWKLRDLLLGISILPSLDPDVAMGYFKSGSYPRHLLQLMIEAGGDGRQIPIAHWSYRCGNGRHAVGLTFLPQPQVDGVGTDTPR